MLQESVQIPLLINNSSDFCQICLAIEEKDIIKLITAHNNFEAVNNNIFFTPCLLILVFHMSPAICACHFTFLAVMSFWLCYQVCIDLMVLNLIDVKDGFSFFWLFCFTDIDLSKGSDQNFVQEYIANPFLVDERKFDIGVYTVLTSIDPLRVYVYDQEVLIR